jgi:RNA polymerase-binding transcription factor DksA
MEEENNAVDLLDKAVDPLDRASQVEEGFREEALGAVLRAARRKPKQSPLPDGSYEFPDCGECGNEIGEGRLRVAINNTWCIECATAFEKVKQWQ